MTDALDLVDKALRDAGKKVVRRDQSLTAQCPAHDDTSPSLSVSVGKTRDLVVKCHAGCSADDVMAALGIKWSDLSSNGASQLREEAVYRYTDEQGTVLFEVVRFHPKTFRQRRPNGSWGIQGVRRVLYRLPKVLAAAADGKTVYIVEGEKDVEAVERAGGVATCAPASNWDKVIGAAACLEGANVVIVADRDATGYEKALGIGFDLVINGVAHRYALPAVGKDAADHLAAGKTLGQLQAIDVADLQALSQGAQDWPDPEPLYTGLGAATLPPFPIDTLPEWVQNVVTDVATSMQVAIDLPAMVALGCISTLAAGKVRVKLAGSKWVEDVNVFIVIGAPPGTGKSPVFKVMSRPVNQWEAHLIKQSSSQIAAAKTRQATREKRLKRLHEAASKEPDPTEALRIEGEAAAIQAELDELVVPHKPRLFADDATPEVLVRLLERQGGRLAILSSEGGVFDVIAGAYTDKDSKTNLDVYVKGHSGDSIRRDRVRNDESIEIARPLLTVCVTTQPGVIESLGANVDAVRRGLPVRFMFSMPPSNIGRRDRDAIYDETADSDAIDEWQRQVFALAERLPAVETTVETSEEARRLFNAWDKAIELRLLPEADLADMAEWVSKLRATMLRTAGLLHLLEGGGLGPDARIGLETMRRAKRIADYWLAHAKAVHAAWGSHKDNDIAYRLLLAVARRDERKFAPRDLYRMNSRLIDSTADLAEPVDILVHHGWATTQGGDPVDIGRRCPGLEVHFRPDLTLAQVHEVHRKSNDVAHVAQDEAVDVAHVAQSLRERVDLSTHLFGSDPPTHPPRATRDMRDNAQTADITDSDRLKGLFG